MKDGNGRWEGVMIELCMGAYCSRRDKIKKKNKNYIQT